jgi:hypothetical protein
MIIETKGHEMSEAMVTQATTGHDGQVAGMTRNRNRLGPTGTASAPLRRAEQQRCGECWQHDAPRQAVLQARQRTQGQSGLYLRRRPPSSGNSCPIPAQHPQGSHMPLDPSWRAYLTHSSSPSVSATKAKKKKRRKKRTLCLTSFFLLEEWEKPSIQPRLNHSFNADFPILFDALFYLFF